MLGQVYVISTFTQGRLPNKTRRRYNRGLVRMGYLWTLDRKIKFVVTAWSEVRLGRSISGNGINDFHIVSVNNIGPYVVDIS